MTDPDDPFADLGDSIEEAEQNGGDSTEMEPTTASDRATTADTTMPETTTDTTTEQTESTSDEPSFSFDEATQEAIYARPESLDALGDALAELDLELRKRDLRDVPKREKHDALARLAGDHVEDLADLIEAERS